MTKAKKYAPPKSVKITKGPQKFELIISLFDSKMWNVRTADFVGECRYLTGKSHTYEVCVVSVKRGSVGDRDFEIQGYFSTPIGNQAVAIDYSSDTLEGVMTFEDR